MKKSGSLAKGLNAVGGTAEGFQVGGCESLFGAGDGVIKHAMDRAQFRVADDAQRAFGYSLGGRADGFEYIESPNLAGRLGQKKTAAQAALGSDESGAGQRLKDFG